MIEEKFFIKTLPYNKVSKSSAQLEYEIQNYLASKYDFVPKIDTILFLNTYTEIKMQKINGFTLADKISDEPTEIPIWIWNEIRRIIKILYYEEGIEYIDITPYNFMIDANDKIWLIDFGHAYYTNNINSK